MESENNAINKGRKNLMFFLWAKRKPIITVTFIGAFLSLLISLCLKTYFLSTAIVFPAASSSVSFSGFGRASSMDIGEDMQSEQMIQLLQSSKIRDRVIKEFGLMEHYEIDSTEANKGFKLLEEYKAHIDFQKTKFGSISISVLDEKPELAAKIANRIVELIDTVKNSLIHERTIPAYEINKRKRTLLDQDLKIILIQLDSLAEKGVVTQEGRSNLCLAFVDANSAQDKEYLKQQIDANMKYGARFDGLEQMRNEKIIKLEKFLDSYEQAESDAFTKYTHKFIIEQAVVADKKDRPKRIIIVLLATLGSFIFMVFILLFKERFKELKNPA